jgi:methionine-rich copper-binding protein CopC
MVQNKFTKFVTFIVTVLFTLTFVSAASSFDISPTSVSEDLTIGGSAKTVEYTITNSAATNLTANIAKTNPTVSGDSVATSGPSTITVLAGQTNSFNITYTASSIDEGTYLGNIKVSNSVNSSEVETSTTTLNVIQLPGASLKIILDDNIVSMNGEIDEKETKSFRIENDGTIDLNNLKFEFYDLEGKDFGDDIEDNDIEIDDDGFDLDIGDSERVEIEIDVPSGIEIDLYEGYVIVETSEGYEFTFYLEIDVEGGDIEIEFVNTLYTKNGLISVVGEPGDSVDDYEIRIENKGDTNVRDLRIELKDDLEGIYGDYQIDSSAIDFSISNGLDIESDDYEVIDLEIDLPEDTKTGTYSGEIRVLSSDGKVYDEIRLELKVIGDIYIDEIEFEESVNQNENLDVSIIIKNQGSRTEKNVKVTGKIIGIDLGNTDIIESTNSFLLTAGQTRTDILRFEIPESARDGSHTLELTLIYDEGTITELKEIDISRPDNKLSMESSGIGQNIIKCDDSLYVFAKAKNIGKYDQQATFTVEIIDTGIKKELADINIDVDETVQQNFNLDLTNLDSGSYEVVTKVIYNGFFLKDINTVIVKDCNGASTGLIVEPTEENNTNSETVDTETKTFELFGQTLEQTQVYLITGISIILILIIISLFFI